MNELLDQGVDINVRPEGGHSALDWAAIADQRTMAKLLIDRGADVNAVSADGKTPLDHARSKEMKALLRKHGGKMGGGLK